MRWWNGATSFPGYSYVIRWSRCWMNTLVHFDRMRPESGCISRVFWNLNSERFPRPGRFSHFAYLQKPLLRLPYWSNWTLYFAIIYELTMMRLVVWKRRMWLALDSWNDFALMDKSFDSSSPILFRCLDMLSCWKRTKYPSWRAAKNRSRIREIKRGERHCDVW